MEMGGDFIRLSDVLLRCEGRGYSRRREAGRKLLELGQDVGVKAEYNEKYGPDPDAA